MTFWATVAGMLAVTFGSRYAGVALPAALPDFWVRCLHFVPIAVFAALVTPSLEGELGEGEIRLAAAGVTTLVAWRTRNLGGDRIGDARLLGPPLGYAVTGSGSPSSQRIRSRWIAARSSSSSKPPTRSATERRRPPPIITHASASGSRSAGITPAS